MGRREKTPRVSEENLEEEDEEMKEDQEAADSSASDGKSLYEVPPTG